MKRLVTYGVGTAVLLGLGYVGYHELQAHIGKPEITVTLSSGVGGCVPATAEVIGEGYLRTVTWKVTNNCPNAQVVRMTDTVEDNGAGGKGSQHVTIFSPDPVRSGQINSGATDRPMTAKIVKLVFKSTMFHYSICTDDQVLQVTRCLDPDVEIWP